MSNGPACGISRAFKNQNKFPLGWKLAAFLFIYNGGSHKQVENYWPLSLNCILCKRPKKLARKHVRQYLMKYVLLYRAQNEFAKGILSLDHSRVLR